MSRRLRYIAALVAVAGGLALSAAEVQAGDGEHQLLPWSKKRRADPANFTYHRWFAPRMDAFAESGYPTEISSIAHPRYSEKYWGYYVGGGSAHGGTEPTVHEGTFGWDYIGHPWFPHKVYLGWSRRRYQGGIGAYDNRTPEGKSESIHTRHHDSPEARRAAIANAH